MQKQVILAVFFFFFVISIVNSATISDKYMLTGDNVTLNGKFIVFLFPFQNGYAIFSVDKVWVKAPLNKTVSGNGADITVKEADSNYAIVTIEVDFACGNGACEGGESGGGSCCKDCGCLAGQSCVENLCVVSSDNACASDKDCDDKNSCTKDLCSGAPRKCLNQVITTCSNGDGCCLGSCSVYNDKDCSSTCLSDLQCNDDNPCTIDRCNGGNCTNIGSGGCNVDGACLPNATSTQGSYCFNSIMSLQKKSNEACNYDFECISYDCANIGRCKGDEAPAEGAKKTENPVSNFFSENTNAYLYVILAFGLLVIIIEIKKYIKDKKEGY